MKLDRNTVLVLAAMFVAGWWFAGARPAPAPGPRPDDRPVLRWIAKAAKNLLWIAVFVEPAPPEQPTRFVHSRVDRDGFKVLENGSTL
jgi:hypothetical protein